MATVGVAVGGVLVVGWVLLVLRDKGQLEPQIWQILVKPDMITLLATGLRATLVAAAVSMALAFAFGLLLTVGHLLGPRPMRAIIRVWIEVFRGLPLLLLIFFIYLGAPALGVDMSTFWALVVALTLFGSSIISEVIRAGVVSLAKGQREAAEALGMRRGQTLWFVLLPQAIRRMLPSLVSQLVILLKGSSLGFVIGYTELLRNGRTAIEYLGGSYSLPVFVGVSGIYVVVNMLLSWAASALDRRNSRRGVTVATISAEA
jgi:glutamate transport system permease protein